MERRGAELILPKADAARDDKPLAQSEDDALHLELDGWRGPLDVLMEAGWVRVAGRREVPGRPTIYATTAAFLAHFGLETRRDLPGIDELRAAGLLDPVEGNFASLIEDDGESGQGAETEPDEIF